MVTESSSSTPNVGSPASALPPGLAITSLCRAGAVLRHRVEREVLRSTGWSWLVFDVARVVAKHPRIRLHEIAAITGVPKATLATTVRGLERRGVLVRSTPQHDLRQIELSVTATGGALIRQLAHQLAQVEQRLLPERRSRIAVIAVARRFHHPAAPPNRAGGSDQSTGDGAARST